jgi:Zn finger protein HypA/HybF involved in hydrogenase expression
MELRYCESCGKVLPLKGGSEEINPTEHFLCAQCRARGAKPAKPASSAVRKKRHDTLDFLSSPLEEGQLDLFSKATLVKFKKKKKHGPGLLGLQVEEPPPMELLDETSAGSSSPAKSANKIQFHCPRCKSVLQIRPVKSTSRMICPNCKLELFVDESCRISKTPPGPAKLPAQTRATEDGGAADQRKGFRKSAHPEAVKLQFHCLHCRVLLRVQRVSEPSRMICPKCKRDLFIDAAGIVSKVPPRVPKVAKAAPRPPAPARERVPAPAPPARERAPAPPPPAAPSPESEKKEIAAAPKPKQARRRRKRARIKPQMVRVSTSLPVEVVEALEGSGEAVSKVIREIIEQKVRPPKGPPIPM